MFYTFRQNNSGGCWDIDQHVSHIVVIEAESLDLALDTAEAIGIYFDGVDNERDCPCCGDRWSRWPEVTKKLVVYGQPIEDYFLDRCTRSDHIITVHFNNHIKKYQHVDGKFCIDEI